MRLLSLMFAVLLTLLISLPAHATVGGGDIVFTPKDNDPVTFSHEYHAKERGIKCMACHFDRFAVGSGGFKINKSVLNKREFCGHCHNGLKSFDLSSTQNCGRCHKKK